LGTVSKEAVPQDGRGGGGGDVAIEPPPERFDAAPATAAPPPPQLAAPIAPSGGVWAVIVGIDDYPGAGHDLRASVNDANDVDAALAAYGVPSDRRLVLRDKQATAAVIDASLRWLVDHASADATVVFFYAGHVRKVSTGRERSWAATGRCSPTSMSLGGFDRSLPDGSGSRSPRATRAASPRCSGRVGS
jgi:hypothetical protein